MAKLKKKITRADKIKANPVPSGQSMYALKIAKRKRLARSLGLPDDTPYPAIWAEQERRTL